MGAQSNKNNNSSQVYYDTEKGQYYTIEPQQSNGMGNIFPWMMLGNKNNGNRNYLGQSLIGTASADRFTPKMITPQYPDMNTLFPALNAGLAQNLQQSLLAPTDTQSSGAGRFIAPSTSKGK
jgi:hypothetical protein